jgi:hypothetical protein
MKELEEATEEVTCFQILLDDDGQEARRKKKMRTSLSLPQNT